jgi:hypothetical protein
MLFYPEYAGSVNNNLFTVYVKFAIQNFIA